MSKYTIVLVLLLIVTTGLFGQDTNGIDFSIRFFDKQIYYPDSDIHIKMTIKNKSARIYRFKLAENRYFSADFDVRTLDNKAIDNSLEITTERNSVQAVYYREISLMPGEEYSFIENVKTYKMLTKPGIYIIRGLFHPELINQKNSVIVSDPLTLNMRPGLSGIPQIAQQIDEETRDIIQAHPLPPDEVITYMLDSRKREQWNRFFLYIDIENMIKRNPRFTDSYLAMSEEERLSFQSDYRARIKENMIDGDIQTIPDMYKIQKTSYTATKAQVVVEQHFKDGAFTEIKEYTYFLQRFDNIWMLVDYAVRNIGVE